MTDGMLRNRLLASLTPTELEYVQGSLRPAALEVGHVFNEPGDEVTRVYFPHSGMISLLALMRDGKAVETATVGREGGVGTMAGFGPHITLVQAIVQVRVVVSQISVVQFRHLVDTSIGLRNLIVRYNDSLLGQVQVTAACNALHPIVARLARWILQTRERLDDDNVPLTHELLSQMLGVQRSSITAVARKLQADGLIQYQRGIIEIVDRAGLEKAACECYDTLRVHSSTLHYKP